MLGSRRRDGFSKTDRSSLRPRVSRDQIGDCPQSCTPAGADVRVRTLHFSGAAIARTLGSMTINAAAVEALAADFAGRPAIEL